MLLQLQEQNNKIKQVPRQLKGQIRGETNPGDKSGDRRDVPIK